MQSGRIELIVGPMFSGKSTELLRRIRRYTVANKKCIVIKYDKDTRYGSVDLLATHDRATIQAYPCSCLRQANALAESAHVIGIDEAQFFPDIVAFCEEMANKGKIVIIAALDGTFKREAFGDILRLLPLAEHVTKLSAVCVHCHEDAAFTRRLGVETEIELIGGNEKYEAVCRVCFHK